MEMGRGKLQPCLLKGGIVGLPGTGGQGATTSADSSALSHEGSPQSCCLSALPRHSSLSSALPEGDVGIVVVVGAKSCPSPCWRGEVRSCLLQQGQLAEGKPCQRGGTCGDVLPFPPPSRAFHHPGPGQGAVAG